MPYNLTVIFLYMGLQSDYQFVVIKLIAETIVGVNGESINNHTEHQY